MSSRNSQTQLLTASNPTNYKSIHTPSQQKSPSPSGLKDLFDHYRCSILLENKGSVARDHLANERTYLAWLRTSLSIISVGIGITQLFRLEKAMSNTVLWNQGKTVGLSFVVIGMIFLVFAFIRYFHVQFALTQGYFPSSRSSVSLAGVLVLCPMTFMLFAILLR